MKLRALALTFVVASLLTATPALAEDVVRSFSDRFARGDLESLYVDFPIGELEIVGTSEGGVEIDVEVACNDGWRYDACVERAEDVSLGSRDRDGRLSIWFDGFSTWRNRGMHLTARVRVPADLELEVDMNIGELQLRDLSGSVTVDMSIGEISLAMRQADVGRISLDTGIGESSLRTERGRSKSAGLFTREILWDKGAGQARVRIELGIGEVDVRLS